MGDVRKGKMGNLLCLVNGREGFENGWKKIEGIGVSGKWGGGGKARERREESRGENSESKEREEEKEERVEKEK